MQEQVKASTVQNRNQDEDKMHGDGTLRPVVGIRSKEPKELIEYSGCHFFCISCAPYEMPPNKVLQFVKVAVVIVAAVTNAILRVIVRYGKSGSTSSEWW